MKQRNFESNGWVHRIKPSYFLIAALLFLAIGVWQLRENNLRMAELRSAVYAADKKGEGVEQALQKLRDYVGSHMNTDLSSGPNAVYPPIQLKYTYERLIKEKSSQTSDRNAQIYTEAQEYCEQRIPVGFSGRYRIQCIQDYVKDHNASLTYISPDLYKFDFYSPTWAPGLAGWSLVLAALSFIGFLALWLKNRLARD